MTLNVRLQDLSTFSISENPPSLDDLSQQCFRQATKPSEIDVADIELQQVNR